MSTNGTYQFRLYVAGDAPNSSLAVTNLQALCQEHLPGAFEIEIVDVVKNPERALEDNVLMTPTLVKISPKPVRRIIGNLSDTRTVLQAVGLGSSNV